MQILKNLSLKKIRIKQDHTWLMDTNPEAADLIRKMLTFNPKNRISV